MRGNKARFMGYGGGGGGVKLPAAGEGKLPREKTGGVLRHLEQIPSTSVRLFF